MMDAQVGTDVEEAMLKAGGAWNVIHFAPLHHQIRSLLLCTCHHVQTWVDSTLHLQDVLITTMDM